MPIVGGLHLPRLSLSQATVAAFTASEGHAHPRVVELPKTDEGLGFNIMGGKEQIDIAPADKMEVAEPYNADRDIVFFKEPEQATHVVLTDGGYVVVYPEDSHKPGIRVGEPAKVRKIVGKVRK